MTSKENVGDNVFKVTVLKQRFSSFTHLGGKNVGKIGFEIGVFGFVDAGDIGEPGPLKLRDVPEDLMSGNSVQADIENVHGGDRIRA